MKTGGTFSFLKAILMTIAMLVIMTNSPPAKTLASVNSGLSSTTAPTPSIADGTYVAQSTKQVSVATADYNSSSMVSYPTLQYTLGVKMEKRATEKTTCVIFKTALVISSAEILSLNQATVMEVTDVKEVSNSSVALTANIITVSAEKSNTSIYSNMQLANTTTDLMRDDRSHILKCLLTSAFSAKMTAQQMDAC